MSKVLLPVSAAGSGAMLTMALPDLIGADGALDHAKCVIIGASGTFTLFAINRFAIEKGALQAAIGSLSAGIVSVTSVLLLGGGFFTATYAGFVIGETDRLRIHEYSTAQEVWVAERSRAAQDAASAAPALNAMIDDLAVKVQCERVSSCVSGIGNGGEGDVFRQLSGVLGNARAVRAQLAAGQDNENVVAAQLAGLQSALRDTIADGSLSETERRLQAEQIARETAPALNAWEQAAPLGLVSGFVSQLLQEGRSTPQDRLLASYGAQIASTVQPETSAVEEPPVFPSPTGVSDTLGYIGHFLPIALLVAVIELILPITLWFYTFTDLRARLEHDETKPPVPKRQRRTSSPKTKGDRHE
ncbi:hypothetical protein [uncultured Roseobacter sp.]|uniref:hypothetical protein n=1 Tax=uncultured Roseobacter sp. TaxID=114847 RepID=UPI0026376E6E|nr:hypothetical protein [uncultured Roseobacter sp.]